jgi:UDP-N-acetylmuramoyl-tripeptide--D-alanyl-D-alanine ligase
VDETPIMPTLADIIAGILEGQLAARTEAGAGAIEIRRVVIDSRQAEPGCLFVALPGEHHDGHEFIGSALTAGAVAVIAEQVPAGFAGTVVDLRGPAEVPFEITAPVCLVVPSSLEALQSAASYWRRQHAARVIGITGSVGKTTCKELIAAILGLRYRTLRSRGNYNNEIGLPLTLLEMDSSHERVVLEMGMYALGEIRLLADIARPEIGVVTNVGPSHLERLGTIERIAQAKAELPQALPAAERGGVAIFNADDDRVMAMSRLTSARVFTYGLSADADLWADGIESEGLEGIRFRFRFGAQAVNAHLPMLGRHSVHSALAAASVALVEGLDWSDIISGLTEESAQLRLVVVAGPAGSTILEDVYNSSPASALAALNLLAEINGRRIAVLGGMHELGSFTDEGHRLVGRRAREVADQLVTVGPLGRIIAEQAVAAGMSPSAVHMVGTNSEAAALLRALAEAGDMILVKGSRALKMEEIVAAVSAQGTGYPASGGAKER